MGRTVVKCIHCKTRTAQPKNRGLCGACYKDKDVRALYPPSPLWIQGGNETETELQVMIAEQKRHLPEWWWDEVEMVRSGIAG